MNSHGHLNDYPLSELFESLANGRESGCLRIEFHPQPALFYFKDGQLVDARMSDLQGFAAIHLAFSRAKAPFAFDSHVVPPEPAINDESQRLLLSRVLGLKLGGEPGQVFEPMVERCETISEEPVSQAAPAPIAAENRPAAMIERPAAVPNKMLGDSILGSAAFNILKKELVSHGSQQETAQPTPCPRDLKQVEKAIPPKRFLRERGRAMLVTAAQDLHRPKLLRTAAAVLIFSVPAVVGLTIHWGKRSAATPVVAAANEETSLTTGSRPLAAQVDRPEDKLATAESVPSPVQPAASAAHTVEKAKRPVTKETRSDDPKPATEEKSSSTTEQRSSIVTREPIPESSSKSIVVVVRIQDGRVEEAWVKNRQRGLEAFEATAIRQARQRRYPKDKSGTETVAVNVSINH